MTNPATTAQARAVLDQLDDGDRVCVQLCHIVPWCDISGRARQLGLIDERGMATELAGAVVRLLGARGGS